MQWVSERASQHRQPAAVSSPSFVRSFVVRRLFVRSLTSFVRSLTSFVRSFVVRSSSFVCSFVPSFHQKFARSFVRSSAPTLVLRFVDSLTSFRRSAVPS